MFGVNLTNMYNGQPFEVVGRSGQAQPYLGKNVNKKT